MEKQSTNNQVVQGNPQDNPQQNNSQNQPQRANNHMGRPQENRSRFNNQDKKITQDKNQNYGSNRSNDRNQATERSQVSQDDRSRGQNPKPKDRSGLDRTKENSQPARYQQNLSGSGIHNNNQNRLNKNPLRNTVHGDLGTRHIKPQIIETVEDIQADAESVEKEIQFEIKQIRATKLGL